MRFIQKIAAGTVSLAMVIAPVTPATAADIGSAFAVNGQTANLVTPHQDYRRRYGHGYRHKDRVDAGDILAGIGILAGIAIIASAASKSKKNDREERRYPPDYPQDNQQDYPQDIPQDRRGSLPERDDRPADFGNGDTAGDAVSACSRAAESEAGGNAWVEEIRGVTRSGNGWRVEGQISGSGARSFTCGVSAGQVDFIRFDA